jgi:hypothetical protein
MYLFINENIKIKFDLIVGQCSDRKVVMLMLAIKVLYLSDINN